MPPKRRVNSEENATKREKLESPSSTTIGAIPREILLKEILGNLDLSSLFSASMVCKKWSEVFRVLVAKPLDATDDILKKFAECRNLKWINLSNCWDITDQGLIYLSQGCSSLSNINLTHCHRITDQGLLYLSQGCPSLSNINLWNCKDITDQGLLSLSQGCPSLSSIKLNGCENITDQGLKYLSQGCSSLSNINLTCCDNITDQGLQFLKQENPSLTIVK